MGLRRKNATRRGQSHRHNKQWHQDQQRRRFNIKGDYWDEEYKKLTAREGRKI